MAHAHLMLDTQGYKHTFRDVMLIAFPLQQWLRECASLLRYVYMACLVAIFILSGSGILLNTLPSIDPYLLGTVKLRPDCSWHTE